MSSFDSAARPSAAAVTPPVDGRPTRCPACSSSDISTRARTPDSSSYWRCDGCGEVWNAARSSGVADQRRGWR